MGKKAALVTFSWHGLKVVVIRVFFDIFNARLFGAAKHSICVMRLNPGDEDIERLLRTMPASENSTWYMTPIVCALAAPRYQDAYTQTALHLK